MFAATHWSKNNRSNITHLQIRRSSAPAQSAQSDISAAGQTAADRATNLRPTDLLSGRVGAVVGAEHADA